MSADTGIYIAKFPDGYRVTRVVQAIENIDFHRPGTKARKRELRKYFGDSPLFDSKKSAREYAWGIYDAFVEDEEKYGMGCPIECGVCDIGEYESFEEAK